MHKTENQVMTAAKGGFTLVELLVVVAILGILGTIGIAGVNKYIDKTNKTAAKTAVDNLKGAMTNWMIDHKKATPSSNLNVLIEPNGDEEPYIEGGEGALIDPWNNPFRIETKGKRYAIISDGPDGQPGTEDDIRSDKIEKTKKD